MFFIGLLGSCIRDARATITTLALSAFASIRTHSLFPGALTHVTYCSNFDADVILLVEVLVSPSYWLTPILMSFLLHL